MAKQRERTVPRIRFFMIRTYCKSWLRLSRASRWRQHLAGDTPAATEAIARSCRGARVGAGKSAISAGDTPATTGAGDRYLGQAAFSFAAIDLYSSGGSFLLGAGVPGGPSPK